MLSLAQPWLLLLALPVIGLFWWRRRTPGPVSSLRHAHTDLFGPLPASPRVRLIRITPWLLLFSLLLLVVALAQPRRTYSSETVTGEGIDMMIALDISGSMQALDFAPLDRLGAAKEVIREFILSRSRDRIGLVLFAARSFTQCPLTLDRQILLGFLDEVEVGMIEDGTAIGLGLSQWRGWDFGLRAAGNFRESLVEMISFLPLIFILIGLLDVWVPKELVARHTGEGSGWRAILWMLLFAMLQAGPLYGAFPVVYLMWKKGTSVRNLFIYMGAFSTLKIPMISFEVGFLGWDFTLLRTLVTLPFIIATALLMERLFGRNFRVGDGSQQGRQGTAQPVGDPQEVNS